MRDFQTSGRSAARARHAMAATSNPLSTLTAIEVLRAGGNAIDAAVAACAVQCVVEPQSTGIGGDCFALISRAGSTPPIAFNGSGRAPAGAEADRVRAGGLKRIERQSAHAVTVPGAVDAWSQLIADHGTWTLGRALQPAIALADEGYPVHDRVAFDWADQSALLRRDPTARRIFLPDGRAPAAGALHRQPELAATLRRIAEFGREGFYSGPVAEDIVGYLRSLGGHHSLADFAAAQGEYVDPIRGDYRGVSVFECPPNGQGVTALEILNILALLDPATRGPLSSERLHREIEATRLAYRDRDDHLADPQLAEVPVAWLLSAARARDLRTRIRDDRALDKDEPATVDAPRSAPAGNTVYLCVVDSERNAVSFINSLFDHFGSGLVSPATGVLLHNRGCGFNLEPGHANCIAGGKRPRHTLIPGLLAQEGRTLMPFGVMGAEYQAMGHAHLLTNLIDHDLDLQAAIDLPRVFAPAGAAVEVERGVPETAFRALRALGHSCQRATKPIGGAQAIRIDWQTGVLTGASDPRKDGCALGY